MDETVIQIEEPKEHKIYIAPEQYHQPKSEIEIIFSRPLFIYDQFSKLYIWLENYFLN